MGRFDGSSGDPDEFCGSGDNGLGSFSYLGRLYSLLGVFNVWVLAVYLLLGIVVYTLVSRDRALEMGLVLVLISLPMFFVGLFGDAEETARYTYPAILCLYVGFLLYLVGMGRALVPKLSALRPLPAA